MFSLAMRVLLIAGSLFTLGFMLLRIRAAKVRIKDTVYWLVFALMLLALSLFPQTAVWAARLLGVESPVNAVYLAVIFLLMIKLFTDSMRIARLDARLRQMAQRVALGQKAAEEEETAGRKA